MCCPVFRNTHGKINAIYSNCDQAWYNNDFLRKQCEDSEQYAPETQGIDDEAGAEANNESLYPHDDKYEWDPYDRNAKYPKESYQF